MDIRLKVLGHQDRVALEHTGPDGGPLQQDITVVIDALSDPDASRVLDDLAKRLEGDASGDRSQME